ncbi:MAG: FAD-dependent oxidoreductase [bacterium]
MAAMTFTSTLLEKIPRSSDTTSYRFSRPPDYEFKAGQWYTIALSSPDGPLDHHFSHADSPTESFVELTTRLTGSDFKNTLDALPLGAEVEIMGPYGSFLFGYEKPMLAFLTGGIGVTPVRSMLRYLADTGGAGRIEGQELVVFYGSMTEDGIVYKSEFDEFERTIAGLRVVHVITNPSESWKGYGGFITADIVRAELADPGAWTYYIVGPPPMITAMGKLMAQLEIPKAQTVIESFEGYTS